MKKSPLVSIIIPVYNEERYLTYCLSSLINQTYKYTEIIIIDDGSTDKSLDIANKYDIQLFRQKHQGPGIARNYGAGLAKGEILAFLDADMKYDKKYIEKLIDPIIKKGVVGTFNKDELIANPDNIWADCWRINSDLPPGRHAPEILPDKIVVFRAILKSSFIRVGGFDPKKGYFDDGTIADKLHEQALCATGAISYHYNPESLSEVYYSSRWIGRGAMSKKTFTNLFRYCFINSLRNALRKIIMGAPLQYMVFKFIYDLGMFVGIFFSKGNIEK
ncbi:MAG TPA: glycosyltransferase family 2 protein [Candidatus Acidoferrales bacterium]|nr:glycosyltransferase family 2 protein [Candidatus Acidoferrales bacterium]